MPSENSIDFFCFIRCKVSSISEGAPQNDDQIDVSSLMATFDRMDIIGLANAALKNPRYKDIIIRHQILPKYHLHKALTSAH